MNARRAEDISSLAGKLYHPTQVTGIVYFEIVDGKSSERILTAIRGGAKGPTGKYLERQSRGRGQCGKEARTLWLLFRIHNNRHASRL